MPKVIQLALVPRNNQSLCLLVPSLAPKSPWLSFGGGVYNELQPEGTAKQLKEMGQTPIRETCLKLACVYLHISMHILK